MAFDVKKYLKKFVDEANEYINEMDKGLIALETDPDDKENLNTLFRAAHTIKGSSKVLGLEVVSKLAHHMEDVFDMLRDGKLSINTEIGDKLLHALDKLKELVQGVDNDIDISSIEGVEEHCDRLHKVCDTAKLIETKKPGADGEEESVSKEQHEAVQSQLIKFADELSTMYHKGKKPDDGPSEAPHEQRSSSRIKREHETIRVKTSKLDEVIKIMGEVVSNQSALKTNFAQIESSKKDIENIISTISSTLNNTKDDSKNVMGLVLEQTKNLNTRLALIIEENSKFIGHNEVLSSDLQEKALQLRMLPLSTIFDSYYRVIRDTAKGCNKKIKLHVHGGDTELDKNIMEMIEAPIMHMIRNAVDHGIETPEERLKAGKHEQGSINLKATYHSGNVQIKISDDGKGLNLEKIKDKAIKKGFFKASEIDKVDRKTLLDLIFAPGFSTSEFVTDISGRGVGMDVVKENITGKLKGSIDVDTKEGFGSTFTISLPLTLAILKVLKFTTSAQDFAVPMNHIVELASIPTNDTFTAFNSRAILLRDTIIPVIDIHDCLNLPGQKELLKNELILIIVEEQGKKYALSVDSLLNESSIVLKPLPKHIKNSKYLIGMSLSGQNDLTSVLNIPYTISINGRNNVHGKNKSKDNTHRINIKKKDLLVLVVDDSENIRDIQRDILLTQGFTVDTAIDGLDGFEKAMLKNYDIIISDVDMPKLSGFEFTKKVKATAKHKDTPVIIITSRENDHDKQTGMEVGASAYIVKKDFRESNLLSTIEYLMN